ncbi:hypothetical protein ACLQ16_04040 [Streptomyces albidoflavus]|uniref:hypothetical protein n=1 Tax=Streptomyces albidoflavus TaxID=1886 RepID=UPI000A1C91D1|nr:hypothetical protein [Streptomyces albidoflavus]
MTRSPTIAVDPRGTAARPWANPTPFVPQQDPQHPGARRNLHRAVVLSSALALAVLRRVRPRRRLTPVMQRLVAADELLFAELYQQLAQVRRGVEQ